MREWEAFLRPLLQGSNEVATNRNMANYLLNVGPEPAVAVELLRGKKRISTRVHRYPYQVLKPFMRQKQERGWHTPEAGIVYADLGQVRQPDSMATLVEAIKRAQVTILDLRAYPDFRALGRLMPHLVPDTLPTSLDWIPLVQWPGTFCAPTPDPPAESAAPAELYAGWLRALLLPLLAPKQLAPTATSPGSRCPAIFRWPLPGPEPEASATPRCSARGCGWM